MDGLCVGWGKRMWSGGRGDIKVEEWARHRLEYRIKRHTRGHCSHSTQGADTGVSLHKKLGGQAEKE